ncbi:uncharacterized protein JCM15063_005552 [Sporobolomyces koalae]|uniref:uncharacterized protein n=1 Tax=Sporobolomyces koalae TaxID=500713 RepID=UPI0031751273
MSASRRTYLLVVLAATTVSILLYTGSHYESSSTARIGSLYHSKVSTPYHRYLVHSSEAQAIPLVEAIAEFSLVPRYPPEDYFNVSICAVPTHENKYLPEWITWHRLLGVQRIYLFDNKPTLEMRRLLKPWLEEGSVVLYELEYDAEVNIGSVYQTHVLHLCEKHVLTTSSWVSHHDVDEFLMVDAPGWSSPIPSRIGSPQTRPSSSLVQPPFEHWSYPLHALFAQLDSATCVPVLRYPFQNVGVRQLAQDQFVTEELTVRDRVPPNYHTYGKIFLHADRKPGITGWLGPHSCKQLPTNRIFDAQAKELRYERGNYPYHGESLPQEGLYLYHYSQRSLNDCFAKYHVLETTPNDWRTKDGLSGCARNYVPTDEELSDRTKLVGTEFERELGEVGQDFEESLASRPESWYGLYQRDTSARDSWQGRMTRAILNEWRHRGGREAERSGKWFWEEGVTVDVLMSLPGIVELDHVVNIQ